MPMKRRATGLAVVLAAAAVTTGCANGSNPVTAHASKALKDPVQALREAAHGDSVFVVHEKVTELDAEVNDLVRSNDLTPGRAQKIEDAAAALLSDFTHRIEASATPTPTPTSPSPSPTETTPTPTSTVTVTETPTPTPTDTETLLPTGSPTKSTGGEGNGNGNGNGGGHGGFG